jgi:hypothetical protein
MDSNCHGLSIQEENPKGKKYSRHRRNKYNNTAFSRIYYALFSHFKFSEIWVLLTFDGV